MSHGHSHGGGCSCGAEQSDAPERGFEYGLYRRIDLDKVQCLNESQEGTGKSVFRAWEERADRSRFVESDDDEELLFNIPFTGNVKLKGVILIGEDDDMHPAEMRLFKNIPHMSFDDTGREADQVFSLNIDTTGELEYPTKIARFSNVAHLSIHISKNFGAEKTKIYYIGLRGEWTEIGPVHVSCPITDWAQLLSNCLNINQAQKNYISIQAHRHEVTICNYESAANPTDHKVKDITPQTYFIS